jgi:cation transport regulator ChaC
MWVFGYGSLMGDGWEGSRGVFVARTELRGYQRVFNKSVSKKLGDKAHPCPTLYIVESESGTCRGIAFEFADDQAQKVRAYLIKREGAGFVLAHALDTARRAPHSTEGIRTKPVRRAYTPVAWNRPL